MAAIITEKFRQHNADQFYESFSEASKNVYYLMIGKSTPFTTGTSGGSDDSPPTPVDDVGTEFYAWDQTIALKNIASSSPFCFRRFQARPNSQTGVPLEMKRSSGSRVTFPIIVTVLLNAILFTPIQIAS